LLKLLGKNFRKFVLLQRTIKVNDEALLSRALHGELYALVSPVHV